MRPETVMTLYRDIVLECQNCYTICRFADATVRRNCPACGLSIQNWNELRQQIQEHAASTNPGAA